MENNSIVWTDEAYEMAETILAGQAVSQSYLMYLLEEAGFTDDEVYYAAAYCPADYMQEAIELATMYIGNYPDATYADLYGYLTGNPFFFNDYLSQSACEAVGLTP